MHFNLSPSLRQRVLVRIAIMLWSDDLRDFPIKFRSLIPSLLYTEERKALWDKIVKKVPIMEKILQLPLPEIFKMELSCFVEETFWQFLTWRIYHENILNCTCIGINLNEVCWTVQGTIDKKRTAEIMVKNERLDLVCRYRLACWYCLEDSIFLLWNQLSGINFHGKHLEEICRHEPFLVSYWSHCVEGKADKMYYTDGEHNTYKLACRLSIIDANTSATEYFFQKLTVEVKNEILLYFIKHISGSTNYPFRKLGFSAEYYAEILCFLLNQMDEDQQTHVLKTLTYNILWRFSDWPWHNLFLKTASVNEEYLSMDNFFSLVLKLFEKITVRRENYNYKLLLDIFWRQSSVVNKKYVLYRFSKDCLIMFDVAASEKMQLLFNYTKIDLKEEIILSDEGQRICEGLIKLEKWKELEFFIRLCLSSKDKLFQLKQVFKPHISLQQKQSLDKMFNFIETTFHREHRKRNKRGCK